MERGLLTGMCGIVFRDDTAFKLLRLNFTGRVQGEDVSMGIWMAAIGPTRYQVSEPERGWPWVLRK